MLDYSDYPELSAEFVASHPLDDPNFEHWLNAWYGDRASSAEFMFLDGQDDRTMTLYIARAWMLGADLVRRFGTESVSRSLWEQHPEIEWSAPASEGGGLIWDATYGLYATIFEPNAGSSLGHLNEGSELETSIYMFWDIASWHPGKEGVTERQKAHFLRICERALISSKASLQESGLHGLGHATRSMPEAKRAIELFLLDGDPQRQELRAYAEAALVGNIN